MSDNTLIASEEEVTRFLSLPQNERRVSERLRAVVGEIALTAVIRYKWEVLRPLIWHLLEVQFRDYDAEEAIDRRRKDGPSQGPLPGIKDMEELCTKLRAMLEEFDSEPPFTVQRLCELAVAPHKQYARLDKLALAVSKLLTVTTTQTPAPVSDLPPLPLVSSIQHVNELRRPADADAGPSSSSLAPLQQPTDMEATPTGPTANGPLLQTSLALTNTVLEAHVTTLEDQGMGVAADVESGQDIERMQEG